MNSARLRGALYGISAASLWGGVYVVSDEVLHYIPPFTLVTIRLAIGTLILFAMIAVQGQLKVTVRDALILIAVGVVGHGISLGAQFTGTSLSNAINGSVITSASPAFILFFAWLILREPLNGWRIGAVALATLGVLIILDLSKFDLGGDTTRGNLSLAFAALTWGLFSVLTRRVSAKHPTMRVTAYGLLGGFLTCLPVAAVELSQPANTFTLSTLNVNLILGVLYLGVISTAGTMWLWNRAFALVEASVASLFFFAQPLVGVLLGTLLLHQGITPELVIGGVLIIGGVLLSMRSERSETAQTHSQTATYHETPKELTS